MPRTKAPALHVNILAWVGHEEKAAAIEKAVSAHADQVSVVYSVPDNAPEVPAHWDRVDYECFFGCKFHRALQLHRGGVMLQIQADAQSDNWAEVVQRAREAFATIPDLGMWAPRVEYSAWTLEKASIGVFDKSKSLYSVRRTDGIVWALSEEVINRLRQADYSKNRLGWGIEGMAIGYAYSHDLLVLRDDSLLISHPEGSGYGVEEAASQAEVFAQQMTYQERLALELTRKGATTFKTRDLLYLLMRRALGKK